MKTITMRDVEDLSFSMMPQEQGQIVENSYAVDWERGILVHRRLDRSDMELTFFRAAIDEDNDRNFEPQNGVLPATDGEWLPMSRLDASEYRIAFPMESGEWDVVDTFTAASDDAANGYAEKNYPDKEWFVLNAAGKNINGGN